MSQPIILLHEFVNVIEIILQWQDIQIFLDKNYDRILKFYEKKKEKKCLERFIVKGPCLQPFG
jgi:hypothetical protein